jgi:hypothetical protein
MMRIRGLVRKRAVGSGIAAAMTGAMLLSQSVSAQSAPMNGEPRGKQSGGADGDPNTNNPDGPKIPPPPGELVEESVDFNHDLVVDPVYVAPEGDLGGEGGLAGCDPGTVRITSGSNGNLIVRFTGRDCGDQFGHDVAIIRRLNGDTHTDVLISAPTDQNGHAFAFFGPFAGSQPLDISAADADVVFFAPYDDDFQFADRISPVSDLDGDNIPELRFEAWRQLPGGALAPRTYIISGFDGFPLYVIEGDSPFDPWETLYGDVDGDGDVDGPDAHIVSANIGMAGPAVTLFHGDVDGDNDVDQGDYGIVVGQIGGTSLPRLAASEFPSLAPAIPAAVVLELSGTARAAWQSTCTA